MSRDAITRNVQLSDWYNVRLPNNYWHRLKLFISGFKVHRLVAISNKRAKNSDRYKSFHCDDEATYPIQLGDCQTKYFK